MRSVWVLSSELTGEGTVQYLGTTASIAVATTLVAFCVTDKVLAQTSPRLSGSGVAAPIPKVVSLPAGLDGYEVFSSEGHRVGEVTRVNMRAGTVHGVEVRSPGCWGYFKRTFVLPAAKLKLGRGRLDVAMTRDEVGQNTK